MRRVARTAPGGARIYARRASEVYDAFKTFARRQDDVNRYPAEPHGSTSADVIDANTEKSRAHELLGPVSAFTRRSLVLVLARNSDTGMLQVAKQAANGFYGNADRLRWQAAATAGKRFRGTRDLSSLDAVVCKKMGLHPELLPRQQVAAERPGPRAPTAERLRSVDAVKLCAAALTSIGPARNKKLRLGQKTWPQQASGIRRCLRDRQ